MKELAVVLLSGGMDSALCLGIANEANYELAALHLNYGQRTQSKELECYQKLCEHYNVQHRLIVDVNHLSAIGGSSLTDSRIEVSKGTDTAPDEIPNSYVPFRNANILAIAVSWAEVIGAKALFIGATQVDFSGYPDCREEFFDAFQQVINFGTKPETRIEIKTPIINYSKSDIVRKAAEIKVPLENTWSCYKSDEEACGECDSCLLRLKGFELAGIADPIPYFGR